MSEEENSGELTSLPARLAFGRRPARTLARIVVLIVICFVLFRYVLLPIRVNGISMEPTYHNGKIDFINRLAYLHQLPKRGDIVGVKLTGYRVMYLKRIIGLPGEKLWMVGGKLYINGKRVEEPYTKANPMWFIDPITLGPSEYYYVGDNRSMPLEYHEHGTADISKIAGKVLY
ncbi:MAG TPA: signal peptidase I [Verrucomicrobiae bacterium]|nr:signal peptidase I [Verrucomicrobiae bacterium]